MRTVRMNNTAAGPDGTFIAGSLATVPDATAQAWVEGGYAVYADPSPAPVLAAAVIEDRPDEADEGEALGGFEPEGEPSPAPAARRGGTRSRRK